MEVVGLFPDAKAPSQQGTIETHSTCDIAVLRAGNIDIIVASDRIVAMGSDHLTAYGLDPADYCAIVVKFVNQFRPGFEALTSRFLYSAGPGTLDSSLMSYDYRSTQRPRWLLDPDIPGP